MVLEHVELDVVAGREADFEQAMQRGLALLAAADGCHGVQLSRGIEQPSRYLLLLQWQAVDDHTRFTTTPAFAEFRTLAGPFFAGRPAMAHYQPFASLP